MLKSNFNEHEETPKIFVHTHHNNAVSIKNWFLKIRRFFVRNWPKGLE